MDQHQPESWTAIRWNLGPACPGIVDRHAPEFAEARSAGELRHAQAILLPLELGYGIVEIRGSFESLLAFRVRFEEL